MKLYAFKMFILSVLMTNIFSINAQSIVIKTKSGVEISNAIAKVRKVTFSANSMSLLLNNEISNSFTLFEITKIFFISDTNDYIVPIDKGKITLYPNPAHNFITIRNLSGSVAQVSIYSVDGCLIKSIPAIGENDKINVADLTNGMYILMLNSIASKFIKL